MFTDPIFLIATFSLVGCLLVWILFNLEQPKVSEKYLKISTQISLPLSLILLWRIFIYAADFGVVLFIISLVALVVMILGFIIKSEVIFKTSRGYFIPLFLIFILRTFIYEPYQVPSGSMIPGLKVGDFLLVNKFDYGLKIARTSSNTIFKNDPEYGDVVVFVPPHNPVPYVKRLIGKPGDKILYYQKRLFVNGNEVPINLISEDKNAKFYEQSLNNKNFVIRVQEFDEFSQLDQVYRAVVPDGMYFVMGDNRDRSSDSRIWGFVPRDNFFGKAEYIWMSWECWTCLPSFSRAGKIN